MELTSTSKEAQMQAFSILEILFDREEIRLVLGEDVYLFMLDFFASKPDHVCLQNLNVAYMTITDVYRGWKADPFHH